MKKLYTKPSINKEEVRFEDVLSVSNKEAMDGDIFDWNDIFKK